jgi:methyl-accepting chemotaxis protein
MSSRAERDARVRQRVASMSSRDLLRRPMFWRDQKAFLFWVAFGFFMLLLLAPFTYASTGAWELLVIVVQLLAVGGGVIAAKSIAVLEVEQAIVGEIEARGAEMLRDVRSGMRARIDLDHLEQSVLPVNPSTPPPAMIRLFQHIIKEARDRKFESSVNVMQPYREEPLEDIFKLQNLQKVALWLGILGTFIGLLVAMQSADLKKLLSQGAMIEVVEKMFGGMIISFSASLAGLQVAVILGIFLLLLRHRQERYFKAMETAVVTMLSLARNAINKDEFINEFGQVRDTVTLLSNRVQQQSRELTRTQQRIHEQTDRIGAGMTSIAESGASFDGFLQRISDSQNGFIGELKSVYDTISLRELSANLQKSVGAAGQMMAERIGGGASQISNRLVDFNSSIATVSAALETQARESAETGAKLRDQITDSTKDSVTAIRAVARQMQEVLSRDSASTNTVRSEMVELSRRVSELSRAIERIGSLPPPRSRSVRDFIFSWRW